MPIDWSHDYGFDGWMGYRDAANERSYIMGAEDGTLQAVLNEDGTITAAGGNIVLGSNGMAVHDLSDASIITPAFGVGWIHDTIPSSEDFTAWTLGATATVTGDTQQAPSGESSSADTVSLPASGDYVTKQAVASPTLANGQSAAFMVYLKAASAGAIRIQIGTSSGGDELGTLDFDVLDTNWRRAVLVYTNSTGGAVQPYATIKRNSAGQLASVYAWGAQMAYDVSKEVPYYFFNPASGGDKKWGVSIRSPLFITNEATGSVLIGNNWATLPSITYGVALGSSAGDGATGNNCVFLGGTAGKNNTGDFVFLVGDNAGVGNTGDYVYAIGNLAAYGNTGSNVIAIGGGQNNTYDKVVLVGNSSAVATANQQIVFGSASVEYLELYGGGGATQASPPNFAINATGGSGTNIAGGSLTLAGGKSTGSGAGGSVIISTTAAGSSGTSLNSLTARMEVKTDGTLDFKNSPVQNFAWALSESVTIESPTDSEDASLFFTPVAITISKMAAVLVGSSTPSVTWTVRHSTDRSATGNEVVTSGTTTTSTTTGSIVTSFNDATIPADSYVWLETTAQSGTVDSMNLTLIYTKDA